MELRPDGQCTGMERLSIYKVEPIAHSVHHANATISIFTISLQ